MNPAMQAMFGVPDLTGQTIRDNFPGEIEDWYDDYDRVLETGQSIRIERESVAQGLWIAMSVTLLNGHVGRQLLISMRDITERKRVEADLALSCASQSSARKSDRCRGSGKPIRFENHRLLSRVDRGIWRGQ